MTDAGTADDLWRRLAESRLIGPRRLQELRGLVAGRSEVATPRSILQWLIRHRLLTRFQAQVVLLGGTGPFQIGNYRLLEQRLAPEECGLYLAQDLSSRRTVLLDFLAPAPFDSLSGLARRVTQMRQHCRLQHAHLSNCRALVQLPDYKFMVLSPSRGETLAALVTRQGPLDPAQTFQVMAQVTLGLAAMHSAGLIQGCLRPTDIEWHPARTRCLRRPLRSFLPAAGYASLQATWAAGMPSYCAPELAAACAECQSHSLVPINDAQAFAGMQWPTFASDLYSLGCLWLFLLTGQAPGEARDFDASRQPALVEQRLCLSRELDPGPKARGLLPSLLEPDPSRRLPSALELAAALGCASRSTESPSRPVTIQWPGLPQPVAHRPTITLAADDASPLQGTATARRPGARAVHRRRQRTAVGAAIIAMCGLASWLAVRTPPTSTSDPSARPANAQPSPPVVIGQVPPSDAPTGATAVAQPTQPLGPAPEMSAARGEAGTAADNSEGLWAAPIGGPALEFRWAPPGTQAVVFARPAELLSTDEGQRVVQALGPDFAAQRALWEARTGLQAQQIEHLTIYVAADEQGRSHQLMEMTLLPETKIPVVWRATDGQAGLQDGTTFDPGDPAGDWVAWAAPNEEANCLILGQPEVIAELQQAAEERYPLRRDLESLRQQSHLASSCVVLFSPGYLLRDGRGLLPDNLVTLILSLDPFWGDGVRAGMFSFYLGSETAYGEMRLEVTPDARRRLRSELPERFAKLPEQIESAVASLPQLDPYWRQLALRFDNMVRFAASQVRTGYEDGQIVANLALPPWAPHNLVLATELTLTSGRLTPPVSPAEAVRLPSIDDILRQSTSLVILQQSLEFCLRDLADDVNRSIRGLPFPLEIHLAGDDLQLEGITRNQQIRNLELRDRTIADLLTELCRRANPITTVQHPSEEEQRLVWAIQHNRQNGENPRIVITTRSGAARKSLELPAVFHSR